MDAIEARAIIRDWWNDCCRKGAIFREHMGSPNDRSRLFDELATRISAADAELAAGERVVETELFDGGVVIRQSNGCEERIGLTPAHAILPGAIGNGARFAIRRLPDEPKPVAVWERPKGPRALSPYLCSICSCLLSPRDLDKRCRGCKSPLASTPSPWPGTTDQLAAQVRQGG